MSEVRLSEAQRKALNEALDELIPPSPDGKLPGAGEIDLAAAVDAALVQNPGMRPVIDQGLATLAEVARTHGSDAFGAAAPQQRAAMMKEVETKDAGFILTLMFVAYAAYYQHPRVLAGLELEARPPHPQGYEMKPHDLTLLDAVRRRGPLFR